MIDELAGYAFVLVGALLCIACWNAMLPWGWAVPGAMMLAYGFYLGRHASASSDGADAGDVIDTICDLGGDD